MQDHYTVLDINKDADAQTIRKAYQVLALVHHPDKAGPSQTSAAAFHSIHLAYTILSSPAERKTYDSKKESMHSSGPIQENISIDEMDYDDLGFFYTDCRCGGLFKVSEQQLENGVYIVECTACSSCLAVDYEIQDYINT